MNLYIYILFQAVANLNNLHLHFHPNNKYNKPCVGDKDANPGILMKIKKKMNANDENEVDYEIIGVATVNYKFNRKILFFFI